MENNKIKIFIVDDHQLFRIGLKSALSHTSANIEIIGEAQSSDELFEKLKESNPDVILLDIIMPGISGVEAARRLRADYPKIKILMLSAESKENVIMELMNIGIDGFVDKNVDINELIRAIECVYEGAEYFGKDIAKLINSIRIAKDDKNVGFTEREDDIIALCSQGLQAKEVADKLGINISTVNTHKNNIFKKLGINNSVELVRYALQKGIISL